MVLTSDVLSQVDFGPGECFGTFDSRNKACAKTCILRLTCRRHFMNRKKEEKEANSLDEQKNYTEVFFVRLETELVLREDCFTKTTCRYFYSYGDNHVALIIVWDKSQKLTVDGVWSDDKEKIKPFQSEDEARVRADLVIERVKKWVDVQND